MSAIEPIRPVGSPYRPKPVVRRRHEDEDESPRRGRDDAPEGGEEPREDDGLPHVDIRA
jgi:hypothetical protein